MRERGPPPAAQNGGKGARWGERGGEWLAEAGKWARKQLLGWTSQGKEVEKDWPGGWEEQGGEMVAGPVGGGIMVDGGDA